MKITLNGGFASSWWWRLIFYTLFLKGHLPSTRPHPNPGASWSTMYHVCHVCMLHQPYMFHVMMGTGAPLGGPSHHKHLWSVPRIRTCFYLLKNAKINYINTVFFFLVGETVWLPLPGGKRKKLQLLLLEYFCWRVSCTRHLTTIQRCHLTVSINIFCIKK